MSSDNSDADALKLTAQIDETTGYIKNIDDIRRTEYMSLNGTTYLDHAGTTTYPSSLIDSYAADLKSNLFGNPHSMSTSSQLTSRRIDQVRTLVLQHFHADPDEFEVVFTANATAAIKLVADAFRDQPTGFRYLYHNDAHTSLVGVRELAEKGSRCLTDGEIEAWLNHLDAENISSECLTLFAYPGQSNMTGQRYTLDWCQKIQNRRTRDQIAAYTLYDAAALVSTAPLDLSDPLSTPDFTALSFYKMFGFPDLGALIVRKSSGSILQRRKYFAGGTVDMVSVDETPWHAKKQQLSSCLEDGTLPMHTIVALEHAIKGHQRIFGSMRNVSRHSRYLATRTYQKLRALKHDNGRQICEIHSQDPSSDDDVGPIITFNLIDSHGKYVSNAEVEKLSTVNNIQLRTGGLCNPGGIAKYLKLSTQVMQKNYAAGQRCGGDHDIFDGMPTGAIRISFGASSSLRDVKTFIQFLREFFVEKLTDKTGAMSTGCIQPSPTFTVQSISIFPIKSCAAFKVPPHLEWEVLSKGLRWDREWCLVHQGSNVALSQKQFPRMTLLHPAINLSQRKLTISFDHARQGGTRSLAIDLDAFPEEEGVMKTCSNLKQQTSVVCGETILVHLYTSREVIDFFSDALGVSCTLARFSHDGPQRCVDIRRPSSLSRSLTPESSPERRAPARADIMLSNESPILLISQSSVDELNRQIKHNRSDRGKKEVFNPFLTRTDLTEISADSFRGNIVIKEMEFTNRSDNSDNSSCNEPRDTPIPTSPSGTNTTSSNPYIEDRFRSIQIRNAAFTVLGPCQRCQMVCVDQSNGSRSQEPFSTLAKTRRKDGRVWFGTHLSLSSPPASSALRTSDRNQNTEDCLDSQADLDLDVDHENANGEKYTKEQLRLRSQTNSQFQPLMIRVGDQVGVEYEPTRTNELINYRMNEYMVDGI